MTPTTVTAVPLAPARRRASVGFNPKFAPPHAPAASATPGPPPTTATAPLAVPLPLDGAGLRTLGFDATKPIGLALATGGVVTSSALQASAQGVRPGDKVFSVGYEGADRAWRVPEGASVGVLNAKLGALVEHCRARGRHLVIVFVPGGVCAR